MTELQDDSMDIDSPCEVKENGLTLYPVSVNDSGEGLPYAPEDFPNVGDKWRWKVGKRIAISGYFLDRYMYLPRHLRQVGHKQGFASRLSLEQYVLEHFPNTDLDRFFASFSWKIPSKKSLKKGDKEMFRPQAAIVEDPVQSGEVRCKAGNKFCSSLAAQENPVSQVMFCDICCSEPGFCRDCCCILCCGIIVNASDGYRHIRCEANIEGFPCGHNCHIDCALRAYMAGTVGGSIGLDAEYYCRRCDSRTDMVSYVTKILKKCESIDSWDEIEKILRVGVCILRESERTSANELLHRIELTMSKLKNGTPLEDIWKKENDVSADIAGPSPNTNAASSGSTKNNEMSQDHETSPTPSTLSSNFDHRVESLKLEDEIDQVLDALKKSQEIEYRLAEERLVAQKKYIQNLFQQLDKERSDLSKHPSSKDQDSLLDAVLVRVDQIKREVSRLEDMEEVSKGFGKVPKRILSEHFGLDIEH